MCVDMKVSGKVCVQSRGRGRDRAGKKRGQILGRSASLMGAVTVGREGLTLPIVLVPLCPCGSVALFPPCPGGSVVLFPPSMWFWVLFSPQPPGSPHGSMVLFPLCPQVLWSCFLHPCGSVALFLPHACGSLVLFLLCPCGSVLLWFYGSISSPSMLFRGSVVVFYFLPLQVVLRF